MPTPSATNMIGPNRPSAYPDWGPSRASRSSHSVQSAFRIQPALRIYVERSGVAFSITRKVDQLPFVINRGEFPHSSRAYDALAVSAT